MKPPRVRAMTPGVPHGARIRAYLTGAIVTVGLCGVGWRAWALQVQDGDHYRAIAERQHASAVDIPAPRGDVLDTRGRPLAISADADSVWANPREIRDVTETADRLATLIGADAAALEGKLAGDRKFVWIDRHVTSELARKVRDAKLTGIYVAKEPRRWYPGRKLAGPVIGRADIDGRGVEGVELAMEAVLQGERGEGRALRDARGRRMFANGLSQPQPGATVQLTIDRSIQEISDRALADAVTTHEAKSGLVVVLDVATSRVLAMSSYPSFDPNETKGHTRNKPVTDSFEAGSVMKVFSIAAAIDAGTVKHDTWIDTQGGAMQVGPKTIRDTHHDGYLTVGGVIKRSSNVGTVKIAMRLGRDKLYAALQRFGFGVKSGIELPGEQPGMMRDGSRWREIELATISFGYGITVTPLQIAAALAALGNHGEYRAPRIVERITAPDGTERTPAAPAMHQMVSRSTANAMTKMLATVFEGGKEGGTAASVVVPGFRSGGKTGTAHKYDPALRGYSPTRYLSSFIGLSPIDQPRLAIVVMIDEPSGTHYYGGKVAGPVFATVASETLRYLGVPGRSLVCPPPVPGLLPWLDPTPKTCTIPSPKPARVASSTTRVVPPPAAPVLSMGQPTEPASAPSSALRPAVPSFLGLGIGRAIDLAREAGIAVDVVGSGQVIAQHPVPSALPGQPRLQLVFSVDDPARAATGSGSP